MDESRQEIVRRWWSAEERLYPVVMVRPDLYERSVSVARAVADRLRSFEEPDQLIDGWEKGSDILAEVVRDQMISTEELDMGLVLGAAFALRYREVLAEKHRRDAIDKIVAAGERGDAWVTVYETAELRDFPTPPYRSLEMRLSDGVALHIFVEVDPETGNPLFGVEVVQLDPRTGDWVTGAEPLVERATFTDVQSWRAAVEELREAHGREPESG